MSDEVERVIEGAYFVVSSREPVGHVEGPLTPEQIAAFREREPATPADILYHVVESSLQQDDVA